jgi:hypothetical protein
MEILFHAQLAISVECIQRVTLPLIHLLCAYVYAVQKVKLTVKIIRKCR